MHALPRMPVPHAPMASQVFFDHTGKEVVSMSTAIRPFTFDVAAADLDDLQSRLAHTRWPERETSTDWSQGIPLAYTQEEGVSELLMPC